MRRLLVIAVASAAVLGPDPLLAQRDDARWLEQCRRSWGDRDRENHCEVREYRIAARSGLVVDGRTNGGVNIRGTDRSDILVRARVQAQADDMSAARALAAEVQVGTANGRVEAEGPRTERRESWSVSYDIEVPRRMNLDLAAMNGGISVEDVEGRIDMETVNGGISVVRTAGEVRGRTSNGGVTIQLDGDSWRGTGVDLRTTNGGVHMIIPENYSARLETGTTNGGFELDFPLTINGRLSRTLVADLGRGGAPIRAITTNGGVHLSRR